MKMKMYDYIVPLFAILTLAMIQALAHDVFSIISFYILASMSLLIFMSNDDTFWFAEVKK